MIVKVFLVLLAFERHSTTSGYTLVFRIFFFFFGVCVCLGGGWGLCVYFYEQIHICSWVNQCKLSSLTLMMIRNYFLMSS